MYLLAAQLAAQHILFSTNGMLDHYPHERVGSGAR